MRDEVNKHKEHNPSQITSLVSFVVIHGSAFLHRLRLIMKEYFAHRSDTNRVEECYPGYAASPEAKPDNFRRK